MEPVRGTSTRGASDRDGADAAPTSSAEAREEVARGFQQVEGYIGGPFRVTYVAWASDGTALAAAGAPERLVVWEASARSAPVDLSRPGDADHRVSITGLDWHPSLPVIAAASPKLGIRIWDVRAPRRPAVCETMSVPEACGVAWSPDGLRLVVTDDVGGVEIWDRESNVAVARARPHEGRSCRPRWSADGRLVFAAGDDGVVWALDTEDLLGVRWTASAGIELGDAALSSDGSIVAYGAADGAVHVWAARTGREVAVLEAHSEITYGVAFSRDGRLLASAGPSEIKVWRTADWACVARLDGARFGWIGGVDFHPRLPILSAKDNVTDTIWCWSFDPQALLGTRVDGRSRRYVNAKVVLLGDTGVGKSGLGLVLSGQPYTETDSTHGRNVWAFEPADDADHGADVDFREVMLWDLAGQPGYRLVHQLHLDEVAVALVVFDARSETDPFAGVMHWARAVAHARRLEGDGAPPMRTFLVAARADRGGVAVTKQRVSALVEELGLDGFFETSAKEGWRIAELKEALLGAIPWDELPTISSNELLEEIRRFVLDAKHEGRLLATVDDLFRDYCKSVEADGHELRAEFEACLGRLDSRGLVRRLRFGGFVLLRPELLDSYVAAMALAAKEEPDGLGYIAEADALEGRFRLADKERISSRELEKLLLIATVEELLSHEVALKEATDRGVDLVFPSQFTRERPDAPDIPGRELTLGFEGALHNVYATLAVRLARSHLFARREMWRNAATYESSAGGVCGVYLRELEEGVGELDVFFDAAADETVRRQFETYVFEHVQQRTGAVSRRRFLTCPSCRYALPDDLVRRKLERGAVEMRCPDCEQVTIALVADADPVTRPDPAVTEMHLRANAGRNSDVAATRLKGKVETNDFDVFLCHNSKDKAEVKAIGERLRERGIHPWLDEWEIPPGQRWQKELEKQLKSIRSAAVFVGSRAPGPWQDIETELLLKRFAGTNRPLIPVILASRSGNPRLPGYLPLLQVVDMREPDPDPFEQLVWGITGERPGF